MLRPSFILSLLLAVFGHAQTQPRKYVVSGTVLQEDSTNVMPYVYLLNSRTGNGTMTDFNGKFSLIAQNNDTILFQYLGYARRKYPVALIKNMNDSMKQPARIIMHPVMVNMQTVTVFGNRIKPNEIDYMKRYIKSHAAPKGLNAFQSPITALYDQFSHKGKAERKLQKIFQDILIQEEVSKKFNPEILRQLTEDETINYEDFRRYAWRISDEFIITHEGYDLYAPIMVYYRQYKQQGKLPPMPQETVPGTKNPLPRKQTSPIFYGDQ